MAGSLVASPTFRPDAKTQEILASGQQGQTSASQKIPSETWLGIDDNVTNFFVRPSFCCPAIFLFCKYFRVACLMYISPKNHSE